MSNFPAPFHYVHYAIVRDVAYYVYDVPIIAEVLYFLADLCGVETPTDPKTLGALTLHFRLEYDREPRPLIGPVVAVAIRAHVLHVIVLVEEGEGERGEFREEEAVVRLAVDLGHVSQGNVIEYPQVPVVHGRDPRLVDPTPSSSHHGQKMLTRQFPAFLLHVHARHYVGGYRHVPVGVALDETRLLAQHDAIERRGPLRPPHNGVRDERSTRKLLAQGLV